MGLITRQYEYTAGNTVDPTENNANEDTLYTLVNGNISNANIAADAAIAYTKISFTGSGLNATGTITYVIDGGGAVITTGIKGDLHIPFACTINSVTMLADQSGSIVVDIWKDTYANYPPTDADSITASATPEISSTTKDQDETLSGWTTSISAGDILRFNVDSVTSIKRVTIALKVTKT